MKAANPWNSSEPPVVTGYDHPDIGVLYDAAPRTTSRRDIPFYVQRTVGVDGRVLEVGCGSGRLLVPLARAGVTVEGIDRSRAMLSRAQAKLCKEASETQANVVGLVCADLRSFVPTVVYRAILLPYRILQVLVTVEEQRAFLRRMSDALGPGGLLVLDVFDFDVRTVAGTVGTTAETFLLPDRGQATRSQTIVGWSPADQTIDAEIRYVVRRGADVRRYVHLKRLRYLTRCELEHLLSTSEFVVDELYRDFDGNPVGSSRPGELVVVARKR